MNREAVSVMRGMPYAMKYRWALVFGGHWDLLVNVYLIRWQS